MSIHMKPMKMRTPFKSTDIWHLYGTDGSLLGSGMPGETAVTVENAGTTGEWHINDMPFYVVTNTIESRTVCAGDTLPAPMEFEVTAR